MADLKVKDNVLGFGRTELKYMLFHNISYGSLTEYSHKRGLFFFNTDTISVDVIKDNGADWESFLTQLSPNNPYYDNTDILTNKLLIGGTKYSTIKGFNQGINGFLKVNDLGVPSVQSKVLFTDIDATAYTTSITSPGVDALFVTEKAVVDYVNNFGINLEDNILKWNGTSYAPYSGTIPNPGYAYFYTGNDRPSRYPNKLNIDGKLEATGFKASYAPAGGGTYAELTFAGGLILSDYGNTFIIEANSENTNLYTSKNGIATPLFIGQVVNGSNEGLIIDMANQLFNIDVTNIKLNKGEANKYLFLDANKNITYVDAGSTTVDAILKWTGNSYVPYTSRADNTFYSNVLPPVSLVSILNYDGIFRSTRLYEGDVRVMTVHGEQVADGAMHALSNSTHAGFLPKLPGILSTSTYLAGDGTWKEMKVKGNFDISFDFADIEAGTVQVYTLHLQATYKFKIIDLFLEVDNGTLDNISVEINGTPITGLDDITAGTALSTSTATSGNDVVEGNRIVLTTSINYTGAPTILRGQLNILRV